MSHPPFILFLFLSWRLRQLWGVPGCPTFILFVSLLLRMLLFLAWSPGIFPSRLPPASPLLHTPPRIPLCSSCLASLPVQSDAGKPTGASWWVGEKTRGKPWSSQIAQRGPRRGLGGNSVRLAFSEWLRDWLRLGTDCTAFERGGRRERWWSPLLSEQEGHPVYPGHPGFATTANPCRFRLRLRVMMPN